MQLIFKAFFSLALITFFGLSADCDCKAKNTNTGVVYNNLQDAINDASILTTDRIKVKGKCVGNFFIDKSIIIENWGHHCDAILDGGYAGRVMDVNGTDINVKFINLNFQKGNVSGNGGGIRFASRGNSNLIVLRCHVEHNEASELGGGIFYDSTLNTGVLKIIRSKVNHNQAGLPGGGIATTQGGVLLVFESHLCHNRTQQDGGGLFSQASIKNAFYNSRITHNIAETNGGGISNQLSSTTELNHVLVEHNQAGTVGAGQAGGGIYNAYSTIILNDSKVHKNNAIGYGGGLFNTGIANLYNSSITKNSVNEAGGGIFNTPGASLLTTDTKVEDNTPNDIVDQ